MSLWGLVLVGGESSRMGRDKSSIVYPGRKLNQREYCEKILATVCDEVFVSCQKGKALNSNWIEDEWENVGPASGIVSAHRKFPFVSWLVLACDFPFVKEDSLQLLAKERNSKLAATYFMNEKGICEPLFAIWEPKALTKLELNLSKFPSPRSTLSELECKAIGFAPEKALWNANTPDEMRRVKLLD